jgi:hypothetical protein
MGAGHPVANLFVPGVAAQANTIRLCCGTLAEGDDFRDVSAAVHVQAARTMALLALDALLGMKRVPEIFGYIVMAGGAGFGANRFRAWDLYVLGEGRNPVL